jgi:hypothetical protein
MTFVNYHVLLSSLSAYLFIFMELMGGHIVAEHTSVLKHEIVCG